MVSRSTHKESVKDENALYIFNRLLRMAAETELSTWKQNQVRNFMKHSDIDEILTLTDNFGRTILDNACSAGNLRLVQLLWPMGAKLAKPHITLAIVCSDTEHNVTLLDYLLAHNPKLASTDVAVGDYAGSERMPLLNFCAKKGDEKILSVLMAYAFKTPESIIRSLDAAGNTPLHVVVKEKVAAQILNRTGLEILHVPNSRGQLPIDCLFDKFGDVPIGLEGELKKTFTFMNTLMNHPKPSNRTSSPPTVLPRNKLLNGPESLLPSVPSMLRRQSNGNNVNVGPPRVPIIPPRDLPKSFLSRDMISSAVARNRAMLLQEQQQREMLKNDIVARQQMLLEDSIERQQKQTLLAMERTNPMAVMEAALRVAQQQQKLTSPSTVPSVLRHPLSPTSSALSPVLNMNHDRYVAAIDAAFAAETSNGVRPSLSMLASALANKNQHRSHPFENPVHTSKSMICPTGLSRLEDHRLRLASTGVKPMYQPRFEDNELHKVLRAKYG